MNTVAIARHIPLRCYFLEARCEFLRLLRSPSFSVPTLVFPTMFYTLFGVLLAGPHGGGKTAAYLLATYGVFGVMGPGLFGFGVALALDRERGFLALKRALPMPPGAMLMAKIAMAMLFAAIISLMLTTVAITLGHVELSALQFMQLFAIDVLGVMPFCAIGLFIGSAVSGQAAPAIINLLYLPMAFLAGLWMPLSALPAFFAQMAPLWPAYHLARIALSVVGMSVGGSVAMHVVVLAGVSFVFFALAKRRLARA